jgi:polysaccharide chain length determinant protein (PEP-CTERM system associated)
MLPGSTYTPEDIVRILKKRYWWLALPAAVLAAGAAVGAELLPEKYRSDSRILVVPQRVSAQFVPNSVELDIEDRLAASANTILSATRLEALIRQFDLFPEMRATRLDEDVLAEMRSAVRVEAVQGDAFTLSFTYSDPRTAQAVDRELASMFIDQSEVERSTQADSTRQFLEDRLTEARNLLTDTEDRLEDYRRTYNGELPDQLEANMQALNGLRLQVRTTQDSLNRDLDRRVVVQRDLANLENQAPIPGATPVPTVAPVTGGTPAPQSATAQLAGARANLEALRAKGFLDTHPDVRTVKQIISDLEAKVEAEALAAPLSAAGNVTLSPAEVQRRSKIVDARAEIELLDRRIETTEADIERFRQEEADYQLRISRTPTRGTELVQLTRDYDLVKDRYDALFARAEEARIAAQLEAQGDNFRLLDQASLPERPVSPNKPLITAAGGAAGFGLGAALLLLFEYRDRSFKTDTDVGRLLSLPVLAVVPFMQSDEDRRRERRGRWLAGLGLGSTVAGCLAVVLYTFIR